MHKDELSCRVIRTREQFCHLESSWRVLTAEDPEATVFQSFDWVSIWIDCYRANIHELFVLLCEDPEGRVLGIAPFYLRRGGRSGLRPRALMLIGTGEPEHEETFSEYMAPLCRPKSRGPCDQAFANAIADHANGFQEILFLRVRDAQFSNLASLISQSLHCRWRRDTVGFNYAMPAGTEAALGALPSKKRQELRRKMTKLRALPGFSCGVAADEPSRQLAYQGLVALHNESWRQRGQPGVFSNQRFCEFHNRLSAALLAQGQLILLTLAVEHGRLAVIYGLLDGNACRYYQSGIDLAAAPSLSPGLVAHLFMAEEAASAGVESYDLLASADGSYKARIAQRQHELISLRTRISAWAKFLDLVDQVKRRLAAFRAS